MIAENEVLELDVLVIGAGIVGLAVTAEFAKRNPQLTIANVDRHFKFGQEASSHNSEVIHASIYYPVNSVKAALCLQGKHLLYEFCQKNQVPHRRCGKVIVASHESQLAGLEKLYKNGTQIGAELEILDQAAMKKRFPDIGGISCIWSPTTGIVDSHQMMQKLFDQAESSGAMMLAHHNFESWDPSSGILQLKDSQGQALQVKAEKIINCAGLGAAKVYKSLGGQKDFSIQPCRGRYFSLGSKWSNRYQQLIYPMPDPAGGLGTHLTLDLSGKCRLGPDVDWSDRTAQPDDMSLYKFGSKDEAVQPQFFEAGSKFLPGLKLEDLSPDYIGVRAKLFLNGEATPDFAIFREDLKNSRVVHTLGVESPGLTASLAIANLVHELSS